MTVQVSPITAADIPAVAEFLHTHLNQRVPAAAWARAMQVPWKVDAPNHGYLLRSDGAVVGAYLAFYSEREIAGRQERFCNLGAWCVVPQHRFHALRLLKALLAQEEFHFTDLSPSGSVVPINTRLKFQRLDTGTGLVPCLPIPSVPGRVRISADPRMLEQTLTGTARQIYHDHAETAAARHLLVHQGERWCYLIFRKDRRKRLPLFASVLYASDPTMFRRLARPIARHLLLRYGVAGLLVEDRVAGGPAPGGIRLRSPRPKMFRSTTLGPTDIDNLYSELVCVAW